MATEVSRARIADQRVLRLITKWLNAGVIEDGKWTASEAGAPQGASASPLLANVYLHYVLDRWAQQWRKRHARGDMIIVRFADDFAAGFEHLGNAKQFLTDLRQRFARFGLELHEDKTRLIQFGRFAAERRAERGLGKPETFDFLGFTHACARTLDGRFFLKRITISKRKRAKLRQVKDQLKRRRHEPLPVQGAWLASVVRGHAAYYAVPGNINAVSSFRTQVTRFLVPSVTAPKPANRPQLDPDGPTRHSMVAARPRDAPLPGGTLRARHPRQEPSAVVPHAGICAGGRP